jgi:Tfp pilus assembly protein PilF
MGSGRWYAASTNQVLYAGDELRTGQRSRATIQLLDSSILQIDELTTIRIRDRPQKSNLLLLHGILSFFHRDKPGEIAIEGGGMNATIRGTEFVFETAEDGTARITLYDGTVDLTNRFGALPLHSGEVAEARPGEAPRKTAVILAGDLMAIQWALYYPAILDLADLNWSPPGTLQGSLDFYRAGNLPRALANYPPARSPETAEEKLFLAALLLSVGNVQDAERWLGQIEGPNRLGRLAAAHHQLIAAVKRQPCLEKDAMSRPGDLLGTEALALSYCLQASADLDGALAAAKLATERSPGFGFAWARRAELEFSFGHVQRADEFVQHALELTPQNAEALSLKGFMLAAENRVRDALAWFEAATAVDGALGNAWLGHGLCRIRQGDLTEGRQDLEVAAAAEPQRALFRSYLGKAFADEWRISQARHEYALAEMLDPKDPTVWLYRSLLDRDQNLVNDAIRDLDHAEDLARNRAIYRSRLLLDQDRAVAAANQAIAFRDAGLLDVGVQSASRAIATDYANTSAHQFLADSYASSDRIDLRYETPRVSEYLVANLLAPVGGGILSSSLSQQEYSKLFERDGLGMYSETDYLSRGAWTQVGGVQGTFGNSSFLAEAFYNSDPGFVPNNDLEQESYSLQFKQQVGARDTFYAQALYSDLTSGDLAQYYNPNSLDRGLRVSERLDPVFLAGWHRAWSPESHTLLLAGVLRDTQEVRDPIQPVLALETDASGKLADVAPFHVDQRYQSDTSILTLEAQQVWQSVRNSAVGGVRYQYAEFDAHSAHTDNDAYNPLVLPPTNTHADPKMQRLQAYAYDTLQVIPSIHLIAGLSLDYLRYPLNFQYAPLGGGDEDSKTAASPKAGFVWKLAPAVYLRGAYTRSLGGVSFEQSFRLEPTQVAGFNQAFRSLIPESVAGPGIAPEFETFDLALEARPDPNTWLSVGAERLTSKLDREIGVYAGDPDFAMSPSTLRQAFNYQETSIRFNVDRLVGQYLDLGAAYRLSWTRLATRIPDISPLLVSDLDQKDKALLHELRLSATFNHPSGFFGTVQADWLAQSNQGDPSMTDEDVWQIDLLSGYRFAHRHAEVTLGIYNLANRDYRLNPLSDYSALERERTFFARLRWNF